MLRSGENVFLDDVTTADVERALGVPVVPVPQDGYELLDAICGIQCQTCGCAIRTGRTADPG